MIQWLTTAPNPRSPATGFDAGQRGWRLHAVRERPGDSLTKAFLGRAALCGLVPRHGWGLDMFIEDRCKNCVRVAGKDA